MNIVPVASWAFICDSCHVMGLCLMPRIKETKYLCFDDLMAAFDKHCVDEALGCHTVCWKIAEHLCAMLK